MTNLYCWTYRGILVTTRQNVCSSTLGNLNTNVNPWIGQSPHTRTTYTHTNKHTHMHQGETNRHKDRDIQGEGRSKTDRDIDRRRCGEKERDPLDSHRGICRDQSRLAPSQWETSLHPLTSDEGIPISIVFRYITDAWQPLATRMGHLIFPTTGQMTIQWLFLEWNFTRFPMTYNVWPQSLRDCPFDSHLAARLLWFGISCPPQACYLGYTVQHCRVDSRPMPNQ